MCVIIVVAFWHDDDGGEKKTSEHKKSAEKHFQSLWSQSGWYRQSVVWRICRTGVLSLKRKSDDGNGKSKYDELTCAKRGESEKDLLGWV